MLSLGGDPLSPHIRLADHREFVICNCQRSPEIFCSICPSTSSYDKTPQPGEKTPGLIVGCDLLDGYVRDVADLHGDVNIYSPKFVTGT
jgi:hypothetical protein